MSGKKRTEVHLHQGLMDAIPIPICYRDTQGLFLGCNAAFEQFFGLQKGKLVGKACAELTHPYPTPEQLAPDRALLQGPEGHVYEGIISHVNGTLHDVVINRTSIQNDDGTLVGWVDVILDITERKKVETKLNEIRRRQRTILDNIPDLAWMKDHEGRYTAVNRAYSAACGIPFSALIGKTDFDIWPQDLAEKFTLDDRDVLQTRQPKYIEETLKNDQGNMTWYDTVKKPLHDDQGEVIGTVGIAHDITLRKQMEITLNAFQDDFRSLTLQLTLAEEKERRRIALELHDHVGQNLGFCRFKLKELAHNCDPSIHQTIKDVTDLLAETIQYTRSLTFDLSPPILYELGLEQAIEWLGEKVLLSKDIHFHLDNHGTIEPISQELKILLYQILRELLSNVAKHAQAKETRVFIRRTREGILITIQDDGIGFDVAKTTAAGQASTGYGLFSIRERLKHIGASFDIQSRPGHGTQVDIQVPISS